MNQRDQNRNPGGQQQQQRGQKMEKQQHQQPQHQQPQHQQDGGEKKRQPNPDERER